MQVFNFSGDGGPGHMFTNMFMQFMNQTTSIFAPFMGMTGGDPLSLFNNIMQQFMSVFGQVTGLWSNTVGRQIEMWSSSLPPNDQIEFQLVNKSVADMHRIQMNVESLSSYAVKGDEKSFRELLSKTRRMMDNLWQCFNQDEHTETMSMRMIRRIDSKSLTKEDYQRELVKIQEEIIALWRMISDRIVHDMSHPSEDRLYGHCSGSAVDWSTTTSTEASLQASSPGTEATSLRSTASSIEFEES